MYFNKTSDMKSSYQHIIYLQLTEKNEADLLLFFCYFLIINSQSQAAIY